MQDNILLKVLARRECATLGSTWNEYLCIHEVSTNRYQLDVRKYEDLSEAWKYYDESIGDYSLPQTIHGKRVVGQEDGQIVGGELIDTEEYGFVCFSDPTDSELAEWLESLEWQGLEILSLIQNQNVSPFAQ